MKLILATFCALVFAGTSLASAEENLPCEWLVAPATEYNFVFKTIASVANSTLGQPRFVQAIVEKARSLSLPYKLMIPLASSEDGSVAVLGSPFSNRNRARNLVSEIEGFDKYFAGWGFARPAKTALIVSGWTGLPRFLRSKPMSFPNEVPLLTMGERRALVVINREVLNPRQTAVKFTALHERVHHYLNRSFDREDFLNFSDQIQEALCDFLPAYYMGVSPEVLTAAADLPRWKIGYENPSSFRHTLILPSVLWRISQLMPEARAKTFFPHLFKELNRSAQGAKCFDDIYPESIMTPRQYMTTRDCAAVLILAVAAKVAPDLDLRGLIADVESELRVPGRVERTLSLVKDPEAFSTFRIPDFDGPLGIGHAVLGGILTYGQYLVSFKLLGLLAGGG